MIEERRNIPIAHQRLVFAGTELENSRTIRAYSIPKSAVVFLVLRRPANALVNISVLMTQTGESFVLEKVPVDDTLADLKDNIQAQAGVLAS
ncbi:MAG: ubiquitin-like protein, partial [Promethearchaeia archaeon]